LELGIDITERKKADEELKKQREELQIILDSVPAGIWYKDTENRILRVNKAAAVSICMKPEDIEGKITYELFPQEDAEHYYKDDLEVIRSGKPKLGIIEDMWVPGGEKKWVHTDKVPYRDEQGNVSGVIVFVEDITEHKKAEESLQESENKYRHLFSAESDAIMIFDAETFQMIDINKACLDLYGYSKEEFLKLKVKDISAEVEKTIESVTETRDGKIERIPLRYHKKKDGTVFPVEISPGSFNIKNRKVLCGIIRDITERRKVEQKVLENQAQLKSLASQLSITEERERRRIATELHDQIGQSLVFSKIKLDELHQSATSNKLTKALDEICNNIGQIIQDTRTLTFDLSSPILNELGLEAAVADWLDVQIQAKHGIETEFEDDGQQKPLDDDIRALLFRNVREMLVNVIKHAHAHKVKVSIRRVNEHIHIDVEDDGKGFDCVKVTLRASEETKFGLFSIRQRLEQLGGHFEIDSEPGRGSKFTMTVPIKQT
jgi:PAS domain S-box-containing protein